MLCNKLMDDLMTACLCWLNCFRNCHLARGEQVCWAEPDFSLFPLGSLSTTGLHGTCDVKEWLLAIEAQEQ